LLQFSIIFFPTTGRYILPAVKAIKDEKLPFYQKNWELMHEFTTGNNPPFHGFTPERSELLKCNYNQIIGNVLADPPAEAFEFMGFALIVQPPLDRINDLAQFTVTRFAVGQILERNSTSGEHVELAEDKKGIRFTIEMGTKIPIRYRVLIWGTYCIDPLQFEPFY
jgi:hypothetical protein